MRISFTVTMPASRFPSSIIISFSIRCFCKIWRASRRVVPVGAVTRFSSVMHSETRRSRFDSKRMSLSVRMPSSAPASSTMGKPEMLWCFMTAMASRTILSGEKVTGSIITPLSALFTRVTSLTCLSMDMLLWMTPNPPSRARATAIPLSVTVSMAALIMGIFSETSFVRRVDTSTSRGSTVECRGTSKTSSNVKASLNSLLLTISYSNLIFDSTLAISLPLATNSAAFSIS